MLLALARRLSNKLPIIFINMFKSVKQQKKDKPTQVKAIQALEVVIDKKMQEQEHYHNIYQKQIQQLINQKNYLCKRLSDAESNRIDLSINGSFLAQKSILLENSKGLLFHPNISRSQFLTNTSKINKEEQNFNRLEEIQKQICECEKKLNQREKKCKKVGSDPISEGLLKKIEEEEKQIKREINEIGFKIEENKMMDYYSDQILVLEQKVFEKEQCQLKKVRDNKNKNKEVIKAGYTNSMLKLLPNFSE